MLRDQRRSVPSSPPSLQGSAPFPFLPKQIRTTGCHPSVSILLSQWAEERANLLGEALGLFKCREVATGRHLSPTLDVVEALGPAARRRRKKILGEDSKACRHTNGFARVALRLLRGWHRFCLHEVAICQ